MSSVPTKSRNNIQILKLQTYGFKIQPLSKGLFLNVYYYKTISSCCPKKRCLKLLGAIR